MKSLLSEQQYDRIVELLADDSIGVSDQTNDRVVEQLRRYSRKDESYARTMARIYPISVIEHTNNKDWCSVDCYNSLDKDFPERGTIKAVERILWTDIRRRKRINNTG